jgi:hypothetical protein
MGAMGMDDERIGAVRQKRIWRVCQNETMDEKTQPVVPSSWEEGLGVVEKNNDITYYKLNI